MFTGSSNTKPSEAMLRNISQNMYGAIVVRSDCVIAGRTWLYCNVPIWRTTPPVRHRNGAELSAVQAAAYRSSVRF